MMLYCPNCRQRLTQQRVGVHLGPVKIRIFDMIKAAGDVGMSSQEIVHDLYREKGGNIGTIKAHICQMNDVLVETDWRIVSEGRRWSIARRRA